MLQPTEYFISNFIEGKEKSIYFQTPRETLIFYSMYNMVLGDKKIKQSMNLSRPPCSVIQIVFER
jgi:hypothetical protein